MEPRPLAAQTVVEVDACDSGPPDADEIGRFRARRVAGGAIELRGWVAHNGVEHIDATKTAAWQVGSRVVVAYRIADQPFPEAPLLMCEAFSRLRITIDGLVDAPAAISVYQGRLGFPQSTDVAID